MPVAMSVDPMLAKLVGGAVCVCVSIAALTGSETRDQFFCWLALTAWWVSVLTWFSI
jgi:hypothetical protein